MSAASLSKLLDMSVDKLPFLRRVVTKLRFRNKDYRAAVLAELAVQLVDDPRAVELLGTEVCENLCDGTMTVETGFFDPERLDNLERLLSIIVEYLPQILAIVLKLFATILLMLAFSMVTSTANAQHWSYPRGSIEAHLRLDHRVSPAGMGHEQMLSYHDSLHESGTAFKQSRSIAPVRRVFRLFRR